MKITESVRDAINLGDDSQWSVNAPHGFVTDAIMTSHPEVRDEYMIAFCHMYGVREALAMRCPTID